MGQARARSQELRLSFLHGWQGPSTWATLCSLSHTGRRWSARARTGTITLRELWCPKWLHKNLLQHPPQSFLNFPFPQAIVPRHVLYNTAWRRQHTAAGAVVQLRRLPADMPSHSHGVPTPPLPIQFRSMFLVRHTVCHDRSVCHTGDAQGCLAPGCSLASAAPAGIGGDKRNAVLFQIK